MDNKSIENYLKMIIEIDNDTKMKVESLESDIANRESQLKKIISDVEANSELLKISHSKKMIESIQVETDLERERILKDSDVLMSEMDRIFSEEKALMMQRAYEKLTIGRWLRNV